MYQGIICRRHTSVSQSRQIPPCRLCTYRHTRGRIHGGYSGRPGRGKAYGLGNQKTTTDQATRKTRRVLGSGQNSPCAQRSRKRAMSISGAELGSSISDIAFTLVGLWSGSAALPARKQKMRTSREVGDQGTSLPHGPWRYCTGIDPTMSQMAQGHQEFLRPAPNQTHTTTCMNIKHS